MREAPSIPLITALNDFGAHVRAYDPVGIEQAPDTLPDVTFCDRPYSCAEGADAVVIVTEWEQFRALDLDRLKAAMAAPVVIDLRNIYRAEEVVGHGFTYKSVGRSGSFKLPGARAPARHVLRQSLAVLEISARSFQIQQPPHSRFE
jgi:UDPglucose 6-dehydrogenase